MNNEFVNDKTDILLYGLRTARQKKRMQYKGLERKLRALDTERNELFKKQRNLGWVELKPPVMRGWKRFFVLREDVARSKHAAFFKGILDKINTVHYSNRKDFKQTRRRYKRDWEIDRKQDLLQPGELHFNKLAFSEHEKQFFSEKYIYDKWLRKFVKVYFFVEPWRFVLRIRPNLITKTKLRDEVIESRLAEIGNYIEWNNLRPAIAKIKGKSYRGRWRGETERHKEKYAYKNMSFSVMLDKVKEE